MQTSGYPFSLHAIVFKKKTFKSFNSGMFWKVKEIAALLKSKNSSNVIPRLAQFDSRQVKKNDLFFAIKGNKVDGHQYVDEAYRRGAIEVVVEKGKRGIKVPNVLDAMHHLANLHLKKLKSKVIGITGSVGKTTTKEFIATLLDARFIVGKTPGNQNSHISLPTAILNCNEADVFIAEMGATEDGDIAKKMQIAPLDMGILTHVSHSHYAFFHSIEAIAKEKANILNCATPIVNEQALEWIDKPDCFTYGVESSRATMTIYQHEEEWQLRFENDYSPKFLLPFSARHHVENFVGAALAAKLQGLTFDEICRQAANLKLFEHRFEKILKNGVTYIDDSYNASVVSFQAAFGALPKGKKRIAVIGEMGELGDYADHAHEMVAKVALESVDEVLCIGQKCRAIVELFAKKGKKAHLFDTRDTLGDALKASVEEGDVVLLKGANSHQLWELLE